jgi:Tol biopolymer transport system component
MRSRLTAVLASTLLCVLVLVAPAHASFPGANGKIAYTQSGFTGGSDCYSLIMSINADGSGKAQATPSCDGGPAWAADGRRLAYSGPDDIDYVTDGQNPTPVANTGVGITGLGWSPDGGHLVSSYDWCSAIGSGSFCQSALFTVTPDGTQYSEILSSDRMFFRTPDWSPDGTKIAFTTYQPGLETIKPDGTDRKVIASGGFPGDPSWSPDGQKIAFTRDFHEDIWVMNADGTGQVQLTTDPSRDRDPSWSPDGSKIAFQSSRDDPNAATCDRPGLPPPHCKFDIFVMNADGSNQTNVTNTPALDETEPSWQPIPGPQRSDYKNAAQFCKAESDFLGDEAFSKKYGTNGNGANAYGKCVSQNN